MKTTNPAHVNSARISCMECKVLINENCRRGKLQLCCVWWEPRGADKTRCKHHHIPC